jgi:hypothetical protein
VTRVDVIVDNGDPGFSRTAGWNTAPVVTAAYEDKRQELVTSWCHTMKHEVGQRIIEVLRAYPLPRKKAVSGGGGSLRMTVKGDRRAAGCLQCALEKFTKRRPKDFQRPIAELLATCNAAALVGAAALKSAKRLYCFILAARWWWW